VQRVYSAQHLEALNRRKAERLYKPHKLDGAKPLHNSKVGNRVETCFTCAEMGWWSKREGRKGEKECMYVCGEGRGKEREKYWLFLCLFLTFYCCTSPFPLLRADRD